MNKPAAITGDYCDLRFIKGRKVAQIVVEIPIEAAGAFVQAFGTPQPDKNVPVALARMVKKEEASSELKQQLKDSVAREADSKLPTAEDVKGILKRSWSELSRAQQAGIACNEKGFWTFLNEQHGYYCASVEDAAEAVRKLCAPKIGKFAGPPIATRRLLDRLPESGSAWDELHRAYTAWLRVDA